MKNNKKGFIFVETIVILTVVALSLTISLSTYSLVTRRSKIKEYYNLSSDIYLLYNISQIGTNSITNYSKLDNFWISENNCDTKIDTIVSNCSKIFTNNDISNLGLISDIDKAIKNNSYNFDTGTIEFLNTLKKYYDEERKIPIKYFIGRFHRDREYFYAALEVGGQSE